MQEIREIARDIRSSERGGRRDDPRRISAPIPRGELWDEAATYVGAIRPGSRST